MQSRSSLRMLLFSDLADTKVLASWQNKTATKSSQLVTSRGLLVT